MTSVTIAATLINTNNGNQSPMSLTTTKDGGKEAKTVSSSSGTGKPGAKFKSNGQAALPLQKKALRSRKSGTEDGIVVQTPAKAGTSSSGVVSGHSSSASASSSIASGATATTAASKRQLFLEIVRQSNAACQEGDYEAAVRLYTEALKSDPNNHILYSNRSAALLKLGHFARALQDANKARALHPGWAKAYYRQGVALQCLGKHAEAVAAFSAGLAEDPRGGGSQLLAGLVEAALKSPLKNKLEPTLAQLEAMRLMRSPFVVIAVLGQELLAEGHYAAAAVTLENALRIGAVGSTGPGHGNSKLNGSVLSALSSAYWALNSIDKAIEYMQQDLAVAKSLGDLAGECRAHGNLGAAHFTRANYKDALTCHRYQLVLAMRSGDSAAASAALTALGHVYTAVGDFANALASHRQCVALLKQRGTDSGARLAEAREIGNVGAVYLVMGDAASALDCAVEHLRLAQEEGDSVEEARALSSLGSAHHYRRDYAQATEHHNRVLQIAHELHDSGLEARAYAGLGHAARCSGDLTAARLWHEKQLDVALAARDRAGEGRACSNLGIVMQLQGDYEAALKLHQVHAGLATRLHDRAGQGRAYGNIGNACVALERPEEAIRYYKRELAISREVSDRASEAATHGNLAVAYQALKAFDKAMPHYHSHVALARELRDGGAESCALLNLGNCHAAQGNYGAAIPFYEQYLALCQELEDVGGEGRACHLLGYAHYARGNWLEAVRYYNQDLIIAKEAVATRSGDAALVGRAYCNLGLTFLALGRFPEALESQAQFLRVAETLKCARTKARALSNLGSVLVKIGRLDEAVRAFQQQLALAKEAETGGINSGVSCAAAAAALAASACGSLGQVHRLLGRYDAALVFHTEELGLLQSRTGTGDALGACRAHANLGAVLSACGRYDEAVTSYEQMLLQARRARDQRFEAQAYGNLGIARMNVGNYEDAASYFEQQLYILERGTHSNLISATASEQCVAYTNLGDCFTVLGDHAEAVRCFQSGVELAIRGHDPYAEERATRAVAYAYKANGNIEQMLHWLERRLAVALSIGAESGECLESLVEGEREGKSGGTAKSTRSGASSNSSGTDGGSWKSNTVNPCVNSHQQSTDRRHPPEMMLKATAYQDLGVEYLQTLHRPEQALSCFKQQLEILNGAKGARDQEMESETLLRVGQAHHALGNFNEALHWLQRSLQLASELRSVSGKLRAYRAIGPAHEALGDLEQALEWGEKHLNLATVTSSKSAATAADPEEKLAAFCNVGRLHYALGNQIQSRAYLQEALSLQSETKAPISGLTAHYFMGLVLWKQGELEEAEIQLQAACRALESQTSANKSGIPGLRLYDQQIAAWQALQRVLVALDRPDAALLVAEKSRTAANSVLATQSMHNDDSCSSGHSHVYSIPYSPLPAHAIGSIHSTLETLIAQVNNLRKAVLYYSVVGPSLHAWLLVPGRGVAKFHNFNLEEEESIGLAGGCIGQVPPESRTSVAHLLEHYVRRVRSALGIDADKENENEGAGDGDLWSQHMEQFGDRLNDDHDRTGFIRMISRSHRFNCSSYSLSSLFSVGSATASVKSVPTAGAGGAGAGGTASVRSGSTRSYKQHSRAGGLSQGHGQSSSCIRALYELLIAPFDAELSVLDRTLCRELTLVLDPHLLLVPFAILRRLPTDPHFYERFKLLVAPSLSSIRVGDVDQPTEIKNRPESSLVVGAPSLPKALAEQWNWGPIPRAENEAAMVAELLGNATPSLTGAAATKSSVLARATSAPVLHFATHISWRLSALVLAPPQELREGPEHPLSEHLLTAAELLQLRLEPGAGRLVVLSSCHSRDAAPILNSACINALTRALLAAGVRCILVPLWPVPEIASRIFFRSFYSALLQGALASAALSEAIATVQHTRHFAHPANWSGYLLLGSDVRLTRSSGATATALWKLLGVEEDRLVRDALRVTLHLVEKALQRISNGHKTAMYTTQKSIENKIGSAGRLGSVGWKEILMSVGFRFEPASNELPAAVFFPQEDVGERLVKCSAGLQAILGLPPHILSALLHMSHFKAHSSSAFLQRQQMLSDLIVIIREVIATLSACHTTAHVPNIRCRISEAWSPASNCPVKELLSALGLVLVREEEEENITTVTIRIERTALPLRIFQLTLEGALSLSEALHEMGAEEEAQQLRKDELSTTQQEEILPQVQSPWQPSIREGGAFTSYVPPRGVRRGEPDGRTSLISEQCTRSVPQHGAREALLNHALRLLRDDAESQFSSSEGSVLEWEPTTSDRSAISYENQYEVNKSLKFNTAARAEAAAAPQVVVPNRRRTQSPSFPIHAHAYDEQRSAGLDLAPPLSKLLLSNGHDLEDADMGTLSGVDLDDETISTFDQLSMAEDSAPESCIEGRRDLMRARRPREPRLRAAKARAKSKGASLSGIPTPARRTLFRVTDEGSPSALYKRDEGDGRSLTDSQYGSYSPSLALNTTAASVASTRLPLRNPTPSPKSSEC